jgi:dihydrofolate synthase / folylpolyglutamate synthase
MTYQQAIDYLFSQLPMFQRIGPAAYKANLDNTIALSEYLGHPERRFPSIHIAGTNGKGSVAHMLASVLQQHGLRTGLATSPHLKDFRERIRVNGTMIPKRSVAAFTQKHQSFFQPLQASFFEISMAMTFEHFARQKVDVAVVETGLGGRLDSTNIVQPVLSIITGIHYDHTALLGNTLELIAAEKAGIIKEGVPVLIGRKQVEVHHVFEHMARKKHAPLYLAEDLVRLLPETGQPRQQDGQPLQQNMQPRQQDVQTLQQNMQPRQQDVQTLQPRQQILTDSAWGRGIWFGCDLGGHYQKENMRTALAALAILAMEGKYRLNVDAIGIGLASVRRNTGFAGRWQEIEGKPRTICDTAHNEEGIRAVVSQLRLVDHDRLHIVFGAVDDKDMDGVLACLPRDADYYFCKPDVPRGLDAGRLAVMAGRHGLKGQVCLTVKKALELARKRAGARDLVFVGGSTFVVAEVL